MSDWRPFDGGASIDTPGCDGIILLDEEHGAGARITLERCEHPPYSITCGVYGSMFHTRYFETEAEGRAAFDAMKPGVAELASWAPSEEAPEAVNRAAFGAAVEQFLNRFP